MGSSCTKRGRVRQEYVGGIRPLIIEGDTLEDGRGMGPNLHRVANGRAAIPLGVTFKQAAARSRNDLTQRSIDFQSLRAIRHLREEVVTSAPGSVAQIASLRSGLFMRVIGCASAIERK
jgi:hypothetical protein